jgi:uncharacterized protein (DUF362 family)
MRRRRFLIAGTSTLGYALSGASPLLERLCAQETARPDLVVAKGEPQAALTQALDAIGGMGRFVKANDVVVVKPNASFVAAPSWGATTHPDVLSAVVRASLDAGARRVLVVDHTMSAGERCFQRSGTTAAVGAFTKAKLVSLDEQKLYEEVVIPEARALHKTEIAKVVLKADVFINVPTAKAHAATEASFGLKNLMGLVWDRHTFHNDIDVHAGIADLATVLKPHLTILDAMNILKTRGPAGPGDTMSFGGLIVGTDPVAVDAYGVGLSTWNQQTYKPAHIDHIRLAAEQGVGCMDLESLNILELT